MFVPAKVTLLPARKAYSLEPLARTALPASKRMPLMSALLFGFSPARNTVESTSPLMLSWSPGTVNAPKAAGANESASSRTSSRLSSFFLVFILVLLPHFQI